MVKNFNVMKNRIKDRKFAYIEDVREIYRPYRNP